VSCLVLALLIIASSIVLMIFQVTQKDSVRGKQGPTGDTGIPEPAPPLSTQSLFPSTTNSNIFISPPSILFKTNAKQRLVTSSFYLTCLQTTSLNPGESIPLFSLNSNLFPSLNACAIGMIWNVLDVTHNNILSFDESQTINTSFLATNSITLQPNDQFIVYACYVL
jgi:hypothetical protein